jgi:hypothetical protein
MLLPSKASIRSSVGDSEVEKSWFVIGSNVDGRRLTGLMQADIFKRK